MKPTATIKVRTVLACCASWIVLHMAPTAAYAAANRKNPTRNVDQEKVRTDGREGICAAASGGILNHPVIISALVDKNIAVPTHIPS